MGLLERGQWLAMLGIGAAMLAVRWDLDPHYLWAACIPASYLIGAALMPH